MRPRTSTTSGRIIPITIAGAITPHIKVTTDAGVLPVVPSAENISSPLTRPTVPAVTANHWSGTRVSPSAVSRRHHTCMMTTSPMTTPIASAVCDSRGAATAMTPAAANVVTARKSTGLRQLHRG